MTTRMMRAGVLAAAMAVTACDDDKGPTAPALPLPAVAGTYSASWQLQFVRDNDGLTGSFLCSGTLTIAQSASGSGMAASLTGFSVVSGPCPPQSFDLSGTVNADGTILFTTGGPRPPQGSCPAAPTAQYSGLIAERRLSARGTAVLDCPGVGVGQHRWTYIVTGFRN